MPKMILKVEAEKFTTRDGTHPDDHIYMNQQRDEIKRRLEMIGFPAKVSITIER